MYSEGKGELLLVYSEGKGELLLQYSDGSRESYYLCILRASWSCSERRKAMCFEQKYDR